MNNLIKKTFSINKKDFDLLNEVMNEFNLNSESKAIRKIFEEYRYLKNQKYDTSNNKVMMKIIKDIEKKENMMMDALNTILVNGKYETCLPVDLYESNVFIGSRENEKNRLSKEKQIKDNRNRKIQVFE